MKFLILIFALFLVACTPSYKAMNFEKIPNELSDCKFFKLENGYGAVLYVTRCPNSSTTNSYGKNQTVTTIDEK